MLKRGMHRRIYIEACEARTGTYPAEELRLLEREIVEKYVFPIRRKSAGVSRWMIGFMMLATMG